MIDARYGLPRTPLLPGTSVNKGSMLGDSDPAMTLRRRQAHVLEDMREDAAPGDGRPLLLTDFLIQIPGFRRVGFVVFFREEVLASSRAPREPGSPSRSASGTTFRGRRPPK
jgi:hypothetical protein